MSHILDPYVAGVAEDCTKCGGPVVAHQWGQLAFGDGGERKVTCWACVLKARASK